MGPAVFVLQESVSCGMKHLCLGPTWGDDIQKTQYLLKKYHFSIVNALYRRREIVKNMQKNTIMQSEQRQQLLQPQWSLRHAAVAAEMKRPQQPEETPAPQQLAEMRQLPVPARLERPILLLPWAQIS